MFRLIPSVLSVCILAVVLGTTPATAQLNDAQWSESMSLAADQTTQSSVGEDSALPEPLSDAINGFTYNISGAVSFVSNQPPNVTSTLSANYGSALSFLGGSAYCRIDFEFAVRQTSSPPVSVSSVPVDFQVAGTAEWIRLMRPTST